jgi:hypothetical protein
MTVTWRLRGTFLLAVCASMPLLAALFSAMGVFGGYIVGVSLGLPNCSAFGASLDFTGIWSTDRGSVTMTQNSLDVTGTYSPGGSIGNTTYVNNSSFGFNWTDSSGGGSGTFALGNSGNSFTGTYTKSPSSTSNQWDGTRGAAGSAVCRARCARSPARFPPPSRRPRW